MIKITANSVCDLSPEIINTMNITLLPISILIDDKIFCDGVHITPAEVFRYVEKEVKACKTVAVNIYEYECFFTKLSL